MTDARTQVASRIRGWRTSGAQLAHGVLTARDPEQAFAEATLLVDAARDVAGDAGRARALAAARIATERGLSGRELAKHLGVSPARGAQLLRAARATEDPPADDAAAGDTGD